MTNITTMTDEECLNAFLEFLKDRVTIETGFMSDEEGNFTHQIIQLGCGDYVSYSEPRPLELPLRPATAQEQKVSIN